MTWLLTNATFPGSDGYRDLLLKDGRISVVHPSSDRQGIDHASLRSWDLEGRLVLPGLAEMHVHLDKTYSPVKNASGTLRGAIESFRDTVRSRSVDSIADNAEKAIKNALRKGVTRMRSHLNLGGEDDLILFELCDELRRRYQHAIDLQFVGMTSLSGAPGELELLEQARSKGMDLVGGAPALESEPHQSVELLLDAAKTLGIPIDLHIDETESPDSNTLAYLAECVTRSEFEFGVTASHCCSLAFMEKSQIEATADLVRNANITVVTLPMCNLMLMGRNLHPRPRGMTPIDILMSHGVNVCAGSDNVQDPFNPFGNYDPLIAAQFAVLVGQTTDDTSLMQAFDLVTRNAIPRFADCAGVIENGEPADLVVLDCHDLLTAVADPPRRLATFKDGELIVKTNYSEQWQPF